MPETRLQCIDSDSVTTLVNAYGKRSLAEMVVQVAADRDRYLSALQEIARWDSYRTLGYEGPKRVAAVALGQEDRDA